jgi:hypothetical protein
MATLSDYKYGLDDCDVEDKQLLLKFREKRASWLILLDEDRVHSISTQISGMLWHDAGYRVVNEARRFSDNKDETSAIAPLLAEQFDLGYFAYQILAISKLLERNSSNPNKSVVSLRRLLSEIVSDRCLFTRENFVCFDGLPYDHLTAMQEYYRKNPPSEGILWMPTEGPEAFDISAIQHQQFDFLSGVDSDKRSRKDVIAVESLEKIELALESEVFSDILELRHKLIAHASDPSNRPDKLAQMSLDKFAEAHRIIVQVAFVLSANILYSSGIGAVPTPQFDQFAHFDRVFVRSTQLPELLAFWSDGANERELWTVRARKTILGF